MNAEAKTVEELVHDAYLRIDASLPTIMDSMELIKEIDGQRTLALVQYALEQAISSLEQAMSQANTPLKAR